MNAADDGRLKGSGKQIGRQAFALKFHSESNSLHSYRLKMSDGMGATKHLTFQAANVERAKERMDRESFGRWAWLWEGNKPIAEKGLAS
ncbi:hypothetical protein GCM10010990_36780 [Croceicoccus mobilis]|uniref:Uncharacterized protein n=1 Tax=Croceicoccus mobilis TaxID=1703339 RepID=A0A917DYD4_9SPHN|nr:hypothetical protein GCM10010990_36780 [Croceicoccus mobilis]